MDKSPRDQTTAFLTNLQGTRAATIEAVFPLVYEELRTVARRYVGREARNATLNTTALVHEAYLRLVDQTRVTERGRAYFFAAAAKAMRRVLVDAARRRNAQKRGGKVDPETLQDHHLSVDALAVEVMDLDGALERLAREHPRPAKVVECRFFGGLSTAETAEALGISERTVKYDWALARAWLHRALDGPA